MSLLEGVDYAGHHVRDFRGLVWHERRRLFKTIAEARWKGFAAQQHFVAAGIEDAGGRIIGRPNPFGLAVGQLVSCLRILVIVRENVNQLDDEIRIRSARRDEKLRLDVARDRYIFGQNVCLIDKNVWPRGCESLVLSHKVARVIQSYFLRVRNRVQRIAYIFVIACRARLVGRRRKTKLASSFEE